MRIMILLLILAASYSPAADFVVIAANTNDMTQGQINALKVFQGEHFPPEMMEETDTKLPHDKWVTYTDGTNNWQINCFNVDHLEKVRVRKTYTIIDGEQVEDVSKRKSYGKKVTAIRIANIREPFNGSQFKIERVKQGEQGSKLIEWGLTPVTE